MKTTGNGKNISKRLYKQILFCLLKFFKGLKLYEIALPGLQKYTRNICENNTELEKKWRYTGSKQLYFTRIKSGYTEVDCDKIKCTL